jgi:hypothetical protein
MWGRFGSKACLGSPTGRRTFAVLGAVEAALAFGLFNLG